MVTYMQSLWETWLKAGTRSIPIWLSLAAGPGEAKAGSPDRPVSGVYRTIANVRLSLSGLQ